MLDVESLLSPISESEPSGPNLEYDDAYLELERTSQGQPERQFGELIVEAEEPDWRSVLRQCTELLGRTKDIRVSVLLLRSASKLDGLQGFSDGLAVVSGLAARYWPTVHPQPDEGDDEPVARISALAALAEYATINLLLDAPVFRTKHGPGPLIRELVGSNSKKDEGKDDEAARAAVVSALRSADVAVLESALTLVKRSETSIRDIEAALHDNMSHTGGLSFADLRRNLRHVRDALSGHLAERGVVSPQEGDSAEDPAEQGDSNGGESPRGPLNLGEVTSREEVLKVLAAISAYYSKYEPSSPIPLLIDRCKRLVPMSFVDIVKDMMPEGIQTVHVIAGIREEE